MLRHIDDPVATESLQIATQRTAYLTSQLVDDTHIQEQFRQNPNSFYDLFILPYMRV